MTIADIKNSLTIETVLKHYGIEVDKNGMACCPFHKEKKASFKVYRDTNTWCCFSGNCSVETGDVIDFIGLKEGFLSGGSVVGCKEGKHQAILKAKELLGSGNGLQEGSQVVAGSLVNPNGASPCLSQINYAADFEKMESSFLSSSLGKAYAEKRNLDRSKLAIGYNALKSSKFNYLRGCIVFGLRDKSGKVVSLYGRSVSANNKGESSKHYYTPNRKGLYPGYPDPKAKKLILTESIIDAATLLSVKQVAQNITQYEVLAIYGTNGLTSEIKAAIKELENLEEVILFFDGDSAGRAAVDKCVKELKSENLVVSSVSTPEGEDINSLLEGHKPSVIAGLLKDRTPIVQETTQENTPFSLTENEVQLKEKSRESSEHPTDNILNTNNANNIKCFTELANYYIKGGIRKDLDSLKVTLVIEHPEHKTKSRNKLDLYEDKQTEKISREAATKLQLRSDLIERDLNLLTDLLDEYRESIAPSEEKQETKSIEVQPLARAKCIDFLKSPKLLNRINELIEKAGVVGEKYNRVFLFGIASSYKMSNTLHALIQGSSGSGKTHLLATIMDFMPPEDTISLTRVTESSFYNYGEYELQNKLIAMEDFDGLEEKAELAFREMQSKGMISTSTSVKNEVTGKIAGVVKYVYGPIASLSATTKGEIYEDNMSRCFLVAVDESHEQTQRIIQHQNKRAAGHVNEKQEAEIKEFLRNCIRLLKPYKTINPFADKIQLPPQAHKIRRLNDLFQSYVKQITLLNQFQRDKDKYGRLITAKEDVETAIEIMFDSIILKVDELDGSLRNFYEKLKSYVLSKGKGYEFTRLEIRQALKVSKTQQHSYMNQLLELEYIQQVGGHVNRGFKYKIQYWDNNEKLRNDIREYLNTQLGDL